MGGNGSSVKAMEDMLRMLTEFETTQKDLAQQLMRKYEDVGAEWDDIQYTNLGEDIRQIQLLLNNSYVQVSNTIQSLIVRKSMLEDYLNRR